MADQQITLIWEKRGKGWCMQVMHVMPGDRFAIAAQLDSGASNGWMGMMSRTEAAELAKALTTGGGRTIKCAKCGRDGVHHPGVLDLGPPTHYYCPGHKGESDDRQET